MILAGQQLVVQAVGSHQARILIEKGYRVTLRVNGGLDVAGADDCRWRATWCADGQSLLRRGLPVDIPGHGELLYLCEASADAFDQINAGDRTLDVGRKVQAVYATWHEKCEQVPGSVHYTASSVPSTRRRA